LPVKQAKSKNKMRNKTIICGILAGAMVAFGIIRCVAEDDDQAALQAKVKVSKESAQQMERILRIDERLATLVKPEIELFDKVSFVRGDVLIVSAVFEERAVGIAPR
jgi:hypothetical protein